MQLSRQTHKHVCWSCRLGATRSSTEIYPRDSIRQYATFIRRLNLIRDRTWWLQPSLKRKEPAHHNGGYPKQHTLTSSNRPYSNSATNNAVTLSQAELSRVGNVHAFNKRLKEGAEKILKDQSSSQDVLAQVLERISSGFPTDRPLIQRLETAYAGKSFEEIASDLDKIIRHRKPDEATVQDEESKDVLVKIGVIRKKKPTPSKRKAIREKDPPLPPPQSTEPSDKFSELENESVGQVQQTSAARKNSSRRRRSIVRRIFVRPNPLALANKNQVFSSFHRGRQRVSTKLSTSKSPSQSHVQSLPSFDASSLSLIPIERDELPVKVPKLSFDLSRVLFNPGVYHLRDPRSRVYNFDPYLEHIMPVHQFNFEALNQYVTSAEDALLRGLAIENGKKYIGSSSSMAGPMSQFHFLLSAWRPLQISSVSRQFRDMLSSFTIISRAPAAIYLRFKDGAYAVDADKEFDTANILLRLGQSMEKLLTLDKNEFERYRRKSEETGQNVDIQTPPEAYHYSGIGDFLLRSQLDAHDERLPGTGVFDLKTRAVAGIRMNMSEPEVGKGYQIKQQLGTWESFEREYYDMMRAAFLKYSLQVRTGRMDGIFVAYHNIARIFGFQYISLPELDFVLHGQSETCLGDQEFVLSVSLLNKVFDMATEEFPGRSFRFHFETRERLQSYPRGHMQIFAEVMDEERIQHLQETSAKKVALLSKDLLKAPPETGLNLGMTMEQAMKPSQPLSTSESTAADVDYLNYLTSPEFLKETAEPATSSDSPPGPVIGWALEVFNTVNGEIVERPVNLSPQDQWKVSYKFHRISDDKVQTRYNSCKHRRKVTMDFENETAKTAGAFYRNLRRMSVDGAAWREEQDSIDAGKEQVWLYPQQS